MAEHMAFHQRAFGEYRQLAVPHERRNAHDGVVTPVWAAIALPPGTADGVGAHAQPHAKLEIGAKGLAEGMPMTSVCRIPSFGSICIMRTSLSTRSMLMTLSASSIIAKS